MTVTDAGSSEVAQQPSRDRRPGLWGRHRGTLLIVAAFAVAVGLVVWTSGSPETRETLDPDNPNPNGARALARVLDSEGVDVEVTRGLDELEGTGVPSGSTMVITSSMYLSDDVLRSAMDQAEGSRVVLVDPGQGVLESLGPDLDTATPSPGDDSWAADCDDPSFEDLTVEVDRISGFTADGCFPIDQGESALVQRGDLTLVGAPLALTNDQILRGDNAAFALRLLGGSDTLVWYVPSPTDAAPGEGTTIGSLLPRFVMPGLFLVALVMVAVVLWRIRRLGPLATEPLPVSVKAIESTLSRGRLYRRAGDRAHAASRLRAATRARVAERLSGSATPEEDTLIRDLARHLGRSQEELAHLLRSDAPEPATDRDLITLAGTLAALEEEVRTR